MGGRCREVSPSLRVSWRNVAGIVYFSFRSNRLTMETVTFSVLASRWEAAKAPFVKPSSMSLYRVLVRRHLVPRFGGLAAVTEADAQAYVLDELAAGYSRKTVKDCIVVLKMILRYGERLGLCPVPVWELKYPAGERRSEQEALTPEEARRLVRYCRDNFSFKNVGIYLGLSTGLRIGEVCALQWKDVDRDRKVVVVSKTVTMVYDGGGNHLVTGSPKTVSSNREVPLTGSFRDFIRPFARVMNAECYIVSGSFSPADPRTLRAHFKRVLDDVGIRRIRFHGLRHTFATRLIDAGCDYKTVSALLGHASIGTTMDLYVHPDLEQKRRAVDRLEKVLR